MSKEYAFKDATKPLTLHVTQADIDGAIPRNLKNCVLTRTARREHHCFDITVFRTVAYVRFTENSIPVRYQVTASARDLLMTFDASGRKHPITVTFTPPRKSISQVTIRSKDRKARQQKSYAKRKSIGGLRRAYTKPDPLTLLGVRNGTGVRPPGKGKLATPH